MSTSCRLRSQPRSRRIVSIWESHLGRQSACDRVQTAAADSERPQTSAACCPTMHHCSCCDITVCHSRRLLAFPSHLSWLGERALTSAHMGLSHSDGQRSFVTVCNDVGVKTLRCLRLDYRSAGYRIKAVCVPCYTHVPTHTSFPNYITLKSGDS